MKYTIIICDWIWENPPCTQKIEIHFIAYSYYNSLTQALSRHNDR